VDLLFLTGFMGAGKSAVGPLVAESLGYTYVDLDRVIEQHAGMNIPDIFKNLGEDAFRDRESAALRDVATREGCVVSTGGGAVIREENRRLMAASGHVVCLSASPEAIVRRTKKGRSRRPVLGEGGDLLAQVTGLLEERTPYYQQCHHIIDTTDRPVTQVADEVVRLHREGAWRG